MRDHKFTGTGHKATHLIAASYHWRRRGALLALAVFAASAVAADDSAEPKRYLEDIKALTTPAMAGRGDGDPGLTLAASMIEQRFRALGLRPAGKNSYLQPFTVVTGAKLKENNRLEILNGGAKKDLKLNEDFVPFSFSSSGEISGPVVFAGYGASATEFGYDDYAHLDVKDKIVVVLRYEPAAFPAKLRVSLSVNIESTRATVNNVLAYLPGKTDEYVIIGAHYDHLGHGYYDSLAPSQIGQIHPGADDNASGTAGVLELARLLAPMKGQLQRGILFASFAGEELGLLGSAEWVKEPTLPLGKAVAMLNMDMIGRIKDDKVYIGGVGTGATLKPMLEKAEAKSNFKVEYSP